MIPAEFRELLVPLMIFNVSLLDCLLGGLGLSLFMSPCVQNSKHRVGVIVPDVAGT